MTITELAIRKAQKSRCRYKVSAIGFNEKGELIGTAFNSPRLDSVGGGLHAEIALIKKRRGVKTILIVRTNKSGGILKIEPCKNCKKVCEKLGITIRSIV